MTRYVLGCGQEFIEPTPHLFSFNSPLGACTNCQGYGRIIGIDMEKVIPNRDLRLDELPVTPWNSPGYEDCYEDLEEAAAKQANWGPYAAWTATDRNGPVAVQRVYDAIDGKLR